MEALNSVLDLSKLIGEMKLAPVIEPVKVEDDDLPWSPQVPSVDKGFYEDPSVTRPLEWSIKNRKNALLVGPPGVGKTSLALNVAARHKSPVEIYTCSGESNSDRLIGQQSVALIEGQRLPIAVLGAASLAFKHGATLILDEVDFLSPEIAAELHPFLETSTKYITLYLGKKVILERHPNFHVVMTANTTGNGEDSFLYAGTKVMNSALMSRVSITVKQSYLDKARELLMLRNRLGVVGGLEAMLDIALESREKVGKEEVVRPLSPRDLLIWGQLVKDGFKWLEAAELAFLQKASKEDGEALRTLVTNRRPSTIH